MDMTLILDPEAFSNTLFDEVLKPSVMMTSSNGNIFRVPGPLCEEFTGPGEFPTQRPVTRSFDVFFDLRLKKRLSKQKNKQDPHADGAHVWRHTTQCRSMDSKKYPTEHDDVIKWKHFRVAGPLSGEFTGNRWIPLTNTSDAELWCFLWSAPEHTVEKTIETPVILDAISLIMTTVTDKKYWTIHIARFIISSYSETYPQEFFARYLQMGRGETINRNIEKSYREC